jgi:dTDP-4-dehydrorhamnose 3,5-epimerase
MNTPVPDVTNSELPKPRLIVVPTRLPGCVELQPELWRDARGHFLKVFHAPLWQELGLVTRFDEEYYSRSVQNVIRGFHFQRPPLQHTKVVCCVHGEVLDVVVDLRKGSPSFGQLHSTRLSQEQGNLLYIPEGLAHAFCTLSSDAVLYYKVATVYSPAHDAGIRWDSVGVDWPAKNPIVSARDQSFPKRSEFDSPFVFPDK